MTVFLLLIGAVAVLGIVASIRVVALDGYRRQPARPLATTYRHSTEAAAIAEPADAHPSDLITSQWLHEAIPAGRQPRHAHHAAGAMVLRPW
jgi:hypothetical protein